MIHWIDLVMYIILFENIKKSGNFFSINSYNYSAPPDPILYTKTC